MDRLLLLVSSLTTTLLLFSSAPHFAASWTIMPSKSSIVTQSPAKRSSRRRRPSTILDSSSAANTPNTPTKRKAPSRTKSRSSSPPPTPQKKKKSKPRQTTKSKAPPSKSASFTIYSKDLENVVPLNTSPWIDLNVPPSELRPSATLTNGQCFNWIAVATTSPPFEYFEDDVIKVSAWGVHDAQEWIGVVNGTVLSIREAPDTTLYRVIASSASAPLLDGNDSKKNSVKDVLYDYFQLGTSLASLYEQWSREDARRLARIAEVVPGCRILRQDPVECLFSFICSSNNNIPRITLILKRLREQYGEALLEIPIVSTADGERGSMALHAFPRLEAIQSISEQDLRDLGLGYRAKYIVKTSELLVSSGGNSFLEHLRGQDADSVQKELIKFHGVGRKVADCVALFSLDQSSAIPVDVHVQHIACRDYNSTLLNENKSLTPTVYREVGDIFRTQFASHAGWAHSLLFVAELPSFRAVLPEDMIYEMDEWRSKELQKKADKKKSKAASK